MDLVQEIKAVRFSIAHTGYETDAVDAYLAKLRGDLAVVEEQRADNERRITELEQQLAEGGTSSETEGTLRRTLLLAQRLADETEAEATAAASTMVDTATADAAALREAAESDSDQIRSDAAAEAEALVKDARAETEAQRSAMDADLAASRAELERNEAQVKAEAEASRTESRVKAQALLDAAEAAGQERVSALELTAQTEAAEMREPIRAEVAQLEDVRSQLLTDISALETHLEAQRTRVKNAVAALRAGMSGSIEDLERVADDEELLGVQASPAQSGTSGADVEAAPDIEISDRVQQGAPARSSVDDVEEKVEVDLAPAETLDSPESTDVGDYAIEKVVAEEVAIQEVELEEEAEHAAVEEVAVEPVEELVVEEVPVEEVPVEELVVEEVPVEEVPVEELVVEEVPVEEVSVENAVAEQEVLAPEPIIEDAVEWAEPSVSAAPGVDDDSGSGFGGLGMVAGAAGGVAGGAVLGEALSDSGPDTEPIPVVGSELDGESAAAEAAEADPVELDEEPTQLFGTALDDEQAAEEADEMDAEGSANAGSFVKRFAESLDSTPIVGKG